MNVAVGRWLEEGGCVLSAAVGMSKASTLRAVLEEGGDVDEASWKPGPLREPCFIAVAAFSRKRGDGCFAQVRIARDYVSDGLGMEAGVHGREHGVHVPLTAVNNHIIYTSSIPVNRSKQWRYRLLYECY